MLTTMWLMMLLSMTVVALAAVGLGRLIRAGGLPGGALAGGIIAGLLLGPSVFGRIAPDQFARFLDGGVGDAFIELDGLRAIRDAAMLDPTRSGPAPKYLAAAEAAWQAERWTDQLPLRIGAALLVLALLLLGMPHRKAASPEGQRSPWLAPMSIGLWSALLPGGVMFIVLHTLLEFDLATSLWAAAAIAIGAWGVGGFDEAASDHAEVGGKQRMRRAALVASALACAAGAVAAWRMSAAPSAHAWLWMLPLCVVLLPTRGVRAGSERTHDVMRQTLMPIAAAFAMLRVDLLEAFSIWPVLLALLLSADGRWTGAFLGAMLPGGRRSLRTMRLVMPAMAAGPTQLAVTTLAATLWLVPQELTLALLFGVLTIEASTVARAAMVGRLLEYEQELDQSE